MPEQLAPGATVELAPGEWRAVALAPGERLRVEALVAAQTVELIAHRRDDPRQRLSTTLTGLVEYAHQPHVGMPLWTQDHQPLLRVADQSHERHDMQLEACTPFVNCELGGHDVDYSCAANFAAALAELGLGPKWIPYPLGIFRAAGEVDGGFALLPGTAARGDFLEVAAETALTAVVSLCPLRGAPPGAPTIALTRKEAQ
jgi:uncharacterized protein YcgI (DUF1989 family)